MRILSIGVPMPGAAVDNHSFVNAPAFFDYDALVIDPASIATPAGESVTADVSSIARRCHETELLLARGSLVVCLARPNTCERDGGPQLDLYDWLPVAEGLSYTEPFLLRAEGSEIGPAERHEPFGSFIETLRGKLTYRAYFSDSERARVIARSAGGVPIAVELAACGGRVVFVPPPSRPPVGEERYAYSNAMQEAIRQTLRPPSASGAPGWVQEYDLPHDHPDQLERLQRLLWREGIALDQSVRDALTLLGFRIIARDIDTPAELVLDGERGERQWALLEVDGDIDAAGMAGHFRLRRRLEDAIVAGKPKRGLLVINGYRTRRPEERAAQYSEALRIASETFRYCVATTELLFRGARDVLAGDEAAVASLRQRLLTTEGIIPGA